jgi:hypothetical protein
MKASGILETRVCAVKTRSVAWMRGVCGGRSLLSCWRKRAWLALATASIARRWTWIVDVVAELTARLALTALVTSLICPLENQLAYILYLLRIRKVASRKAHLVLNTLFGRIIQL